MNAGQTSPDSPAKAPSRLASGRLKVLNHNHKSELGHSIEVAGRRPERRKGLLGRADLPEGGGLWIVPCEAVHTFGMRFPIDLVYLDRHMRVKKVRSDVGPWRMSGCLTAHSVLELPAGTVRRSGTKQGDLLELIPTADRPHAEGKTEWQSS